MIDPGHPFSIPYRDLVTRFEERIRQGVEQPASVRFVYQNAVTTYELPKIASQISSVTGFITDGGQVTIFEEGSHFRFSNNRIIWLADAEILPKDSTRFTVDYTYRERPPGLNDFNPGSVVGTLIRAIAREIKLLYEQMDQAYRRAFIDIATGVALDNVVALLGVTRNPALKSTGYITFLRKKPVDVDILIEMNTRIADESGRTFMTTEDAIIPEGEESVIVPIEAVEPGPDGNVNAESIVIMPTPPTGVDGVINKEPIIGGKEAEPDDQLRERAKHELERSGNATLNAVKFAVLDVDGVDDVQVIDHSVDDTIPLGEIRVRYSGIVESEKVQTAVDKTRAAGILARPETVNEILISGTFYLIPDATVPELAKKNFLTAAIESIESLSIGQSLFLRRLNALVYGINGLADVAEAQLKYPDPNNPGTFLDVTDSFLIRNNELLRPDKTKLVVHVVESLKATGIGEDGNNYQFELQLIDDEEAAIRFKSFSIYINVTLTAYLEINGQPENIGNFSLPASFINTDIVTLSVDITGFDPSRHKKNVDVSMSAAVYPGIKNEDAKLSIQLKS